jgi:hypothetical protein
MLKEDQVKKREHVRRSYMVDKTFQLKFIGLVVLVQICAAFVVLFGVSFLFLFVFNADTLACPLNHWVFIQWGIMLACVCLGLIIWAVAYTHRIIGPILRARLLLRAAASGDIPEGAVKFRTHDYFKDLEGDLTACFENMRKYRDGGASPAPGR